MQKFDKNKNNSITLQIMIGYNQIDLIIVFYFVQTENIKSLQFVDFDEF